MTRQIWCGGGGDGSAESWRRRETYRRDWLSSRAWRASFGLFLHGWMRRALYLRGASIPRRTWRRLHRQIGVAGAKNLAVSCARLDGGVMRVRPVYCVGLYRSVDWLEWSFCCGHGGCAMSCVSARGWAVYWAQRHWRDRRFVAGFWYRWRRGHGHHCCRYCRGGY